MDDTLLHMKRQLVIYVFRSSPSIYILWFLTFYEIVTAMVLWRALMIFLSNSFIRHFLNDELGTLSSTSAVDYQCLILIMNIIVWVLSGENGVILVGSQIGFVTLIHKEWLMMWVDQTVYIQICHACTVSTFPYSSFNYFIYEAWLVCTKKLLRCSDENWWK